MLNKYVLSKSHLNLFFRNNANTTNFHSSHLWLILSRRETPYVNYKFGDLHNYYHNLGGGPKGELYV